MPRVSGALRWLDDADQGAPAAVEETLKLLGKAARAHQLYLHNNPTYHRSLELLRASFGRLWAQLPELPLAVTEASLLWEGRSVYQEPERGSDTLPWILFKDGVREIQLLPGFEEEEVERFLAVLLRLRRRGEVDDDAITLLWEGDFSYLRYRFVEPQEDDAGGFEVSPEPGRRPGASVEPTQPVPGVVDLREFDGALYFLSERELAYLREKLDQEYRADLRIDVVSILLDVLEVERDAGARDEVCAALEQLLPHYLVGGHFRAVAALLREASVAAGRASELREAHRARLLRLAASLSEPGPVAQLADALDAAAEPPTEPELAALLGELRPAALGPLLQAIERVEGSRLRGALRAAADRLALANTAELVRLITHEDPGVAREAVLRAGTLRVAAAVPALGALLSRADTQLRQRAAEALARIGTPGALEKLATAVDDASRDVRVAAYRALAQGGFRGASERLEPLVRDRRRDSDLTEQMALFEAYGACCGDAGVPLLDGLLNGRTLLGRRQESHARACAAVALGRVGTPRAAKALSKAVEERDVVVRAAVQRAMRGWS